MGGLLILSDLHLGDGSPADDFNADTELVELLRNYRDETIVLAGDVFELWQCSPAQIMRAHPQVCQAIEDYVDFIVAGNHDAYLSHICGKELLPQIIIKDTIILHGHCFDPFLTPLNPLLCQFCAVLERVVSPDVDNWILNAFKVLRHGKQSRLS